MERKYAYPKGQIISNRFLVSSNSFLLLQWIWSFVSKENSRTPKSPSEIIWPLWALRNIVKKELHSAKGDTLFENIFSFGSKARGKDHPVCFSPCFVKDAICLAAGRKKNSWNALVSFLLHKGRESRSYIILLLEENPGGPQKKNPIVKVSSSLQ